MEFTFTFEEIVLAEEQMGNKVELASGSDLYKLLELKASEIWFGRSLEATFSCPLFHR